MAASLPAASAGRKSRRRAGPSDRPGMASRRLGNRGAGGCRLSYRPGGMRVLAGSIILEPPGVSAARFQHEVAAKGVRLAKPGFGSFASPFDYVPLDLVGSRRRPDWPTSCIPVGRRTGRRRSPPSTFWRCARMFRFTSTAARSPCPTGISNASSGKAIWRCSSAPQAICAPRCPAPHWWSGMGRWTVCSFATDTPTGSGIMPLGVLYTISHVASLGKVAPEIAIAAATGNNARYHAGLGDIQCDGRRRRPRHGRRTTWWIARRCAVRTLLAGDIPAIAGVISNGVPRFVGRAAATRRPSIRQAQGVQSRAVRFFVIAPLRSVACRSGERHDAILSWGGRSGRGDLRARTPARGMSVVAHRGRALKQPATSCGDHPSGDVDTGGSRRLRRYQDARFPARAIFSFGTDLLAAKLRNSTMNCWRTDTRFPFVVQCEQHKIA